MVDPILTIGVVLGFFLLMIFGALVFAYYSGKKDQEYELAMTTVEHGNDGNPVSKEKETIIREVVMIPCQYCGGLMPQTATFCSNCGARRRV
jgi:hypothetical protein